MLSSRNSAFGVAMIVGGTCLLASHMRPALALYYSACVVSDECCPNPPPGQYCNVVAPNDGSQPQTGGVASTWDACAYVASDCNPGCPCGDAVADGDSTNCQ
jgi:hypothetical protein